MHAGLSIITVREHIALQLFGVVAVTVNVYEPELPAFTEMEDPVVDPLIEPLPLIDHAKVALVLLETVYPFDVEAQTGSGPEIVHDGLSIAAVFVHVDVQPIFVAVTVSVYEPELPAVTFTDEPVVVLRDPLPLIDQLYEAYPITVPTL